MGQYTVDMSKYGWFPDQLPSEADQVESSDNDENETGDEAAEDEAAYHT